MRERERERETNMIYQNSANTLIITKKFLHELHCYKREGKKKREKKEREEKGEKEKRRGEEKETGKKGEGEKKGKKEKNTNTHLDPKFHNANLVPR